MGRRGAVQTLRDVGPSNPDDPSPGGPAGKPPLGRSRRPVLLPPRPPHARPRPPPRRTPPGLALLAATLLVASAAARAQVASAAPAAAAAHPTATPVASATHRDGAVVIDGRPDEAAWARAMPVTALRQSQPAEGEAASLPTEVRLFYDDQALFVSAWMRDPLGAAGSPTADDAAGLGDPEIAVQAAAPPPAAAHRGGPNARSMAPGQTHPEAFAAENRAARLTWVTGHRHSA